MLSYVKVVKDALNTFRRGRCNIYDVMPIKKNGITYNDNWEMVARDIPCHLSFGGASPLNQTETTANADKVATLFLDTNIRVKEGSKVVISQNDVINTYYCTGVASVYSTHQEIGLKRGVKA